MELHKINEILNLSSLDIVLIIVSPICAMLGSFAHFCLLEINPNKTPRPGTTIRVSNLDALGRLKWLILRLFIGGLLGLLFAFYFVGTLSETPSSLFKLLAFAILIGFSAPRLWFLQEKILMEQVDSKINQALKAALGSCNPENAQQDNTADRQATPASR